MKIQSRVLILSILTSSIVTFFIQCIFRAEINYFLLPLIFILPGLEIYLILTRKPEILDLVFFSVVLSMASVAVPLFVAVYYFKLSLLNIAIYYPFIIIIISIIYTWKAKNVEIRGVPGDIKPIIYFGLTALLILFPFQFMRLQLNFDGNYFSTIVYQIINGNIPPTNHALFDAPVNTYWPYMLYMAFLAILVKASPVYVNGLTWPILLWVILQVGYLLARYFFKSRFSRILSAYMIVFGLAIHNIFIWIARIFKHPDWLWKIQYSMPHDVVGWVSYYWRDPRLTEFVNKIINYHGFLAAYLFFLTILYLFFRIHKDGENRHILSVMMVVTVLILFHPTTVLTVIFLMPLYLWGLFYRSTFNVRRINRKDFAFLLMSFLLPFFFLYSFIKSVSIATRVPTISIFYNWVNTNGILFSYIVVWPLIWIGLKKIIASLISRVEWQVILASTAALTLMSIFYNLPDGNQYKFIFLLNIPMTFIILKGAENYKYLLRIFLIFCFVQFLFVLEIYINSSWGRQPFELVNNGTNIDLVEKHNYSDSFNWLRLNAPLNSIVVSLPYYEYTSLLSQRRAYVMIPGNIFVVGYPKYQERVEILDSLDKNKISLDKAAEIIKKDIKTTPLYIFLLKNKIYDQVLTDQIIESKAVELVYKDRYVWIVKI